jgi:hypothetical protein
MYMCSVITFHHQTQFIKFSLQEYPTSQCQFLCYAILNNKYVNKNGSNSNFQIKKHTSHSHNVISNCQKTR